MKIFPRGGILRHYYFQRIRMSFFIFLRGLVNLSGKVNLMHSLLNIPEFNKKSQCIRLMTKKMFLPAIQGRLKMPHAVCLSVARRAVDSYPRKFLKSLFPCLIVFLLFVPPCLCESPSPSKTDSGLSKLLGFQEKLE